MQKIHNDWIDTTSGDKIPEGDLVQCLFCDKSIKEVQSITKSPTGATICDECITLCEEIITESTA